MTLTAEQEKKLKIRRTVSFIIVALAYFFVQFHRSTSGVIKADLEQTFTMTATSFATLSSMYFYPYMLMLGMTCDPVCGLVQIPCIERNAVAALRAMNACNLSYFLTGSRNISYDMQRHLRRAAPAGPPS